ncbi:general substrate transporter [Ephemerocybe angulata]|uniref:General substrate transporter n=1 Tax=Ephemerocybe angulata TaxID=980116 RepID=A0A8H6M438_9AGAR|nr:general substrate transporter [Tulosesus angulatus]
MPSFQRAFPSFTDSTLKGLATSMINLGALLGTDKFGRRRSITLSCVWLILGTALQTGARSPAYFYVGRFFTGIAVGALSSATPLYNSEISPTSIRGAVGSLFQFSIEVGTLIAFWIDFGCNYIGGTGETQTEAAWRIPLALQLVPCFILAVGILFAPESPRWLVSKSRDAEALRALVSLRQRPEDSDEIQLEYLEIVGQHKFESEIAALEKDPNEKATGWMASLRTSWRQWAYLFGSAANRKRLLVGVMIMTFQQWCGINAIMFYAPQIFQGLGLSGTTVSLLATGVIGIVMLIATVPTVLYLDRVGRKPVLIYGALFMGTCHAVIAGLSGKYEDSWVTHKAAGWVSCVFVWIFTVGFAATFGPVVWVLCSEIFPLRARTKGLAVSVSVSWINAFIVGMATPTMLDNMRYGTYIFFAAWCFIGAAYCCTIPETAGRRLEDMDAAFGDTSNSSEEDKARMARINKEIGYDKYQMGHLSDSKSEM